MAGEHVRLDLGHPSPFAKASPASQLPTASYRQRLNHNNWIKGIPLFRVTLNGGWYNLPTGVANKFLFGYVRLAPTKQRAQVGLLHWT